MYLKSKDVKVYPSAYRGKVEESGVIKLFDPESRLPDEYNIRNQASQLVSYKDGFITYPKCGDTWSKEKLVFNLGGYRFELDSEAITELLAQTGEVYACLKTADKNTASDIQITDYAANSLVPYEGSNESLDNADSITTSEFRGLSFENSEPTTSANTYSFLLIKDGDLNKNAYIKFKASDVLGDIEDGEDIALDKQLKTDRIRANNVHGIGDLEITAGGSIDIKPTNDFGITAEYINISGATITVKPSNKFVVDGDTEFNETLLVSGQSTFKDTVTIQDKTVATKKITINPADEKITAKTFDGTAANALQAKKLVNGTGVAYNVGNTDIPIYFKNGVPALCNEILPSHIFKHDYKLDTSAAKRKEWFTIPEELKNKEIRIEVQGCGVNAGKISSNRLLTDWFKISDYLNYSLPILVNSVSKDYFSENNVTGRLVISKTDKDSRGNYKFSASSDRGSGDEANWSKSVFVDKTYTMITTSEGERRWCKAIVYYKANSEVRDGWYSGTDN